MRSLVLSLARQPQIQGLFTHGPGRALAARFVAGETLDDALVVAERLADRGARVSLDYLGEAVQSLDEAEAAAEVYLRTIQRLKNAELTASLSLKPTQFGVALSPIRCRELIGEVVAEAATLPSGVRLDMEDSAHTEGTLALARDLAARGRPVGIVLQAALYRTKADLTTAIASGTSVRLCKGAYAEPATIAYPRKGDVDTAYADLLDRLLVSAAEGPPPAPGQLPRAAIATHDERLIRRAIRKIQSLNLDRRCYEFQMLYGVRRDLQESLIARGYPLRIYTPWGPSWYPYLSRRLAERPANVAFVVSSLLAEFGSHHPARAVGEKAVAGRR